MKYHKLILLILAIALTLAQSDVWAESIPLKIPFTGTVQVKDVPEFQGTGLFKFAILSKDGSQVYWSNDNQTPIDVNKQPPTHVTITVNKGVFSVDLGGPGMTQLTADIFDNAETHLRIWFSDGTKDSAGNPIFELLSPDRQLVSVPYAYKAEKAAKALDSEKIGGKSISDLGGGTVTNVGSGPGLTGGPITESGTLSVAPNSITTDMIANGTITNDDISPTADIVDSKLATIASQGKVADTALSVNVTKLGEKIDLSLGTEVTGALDDQFVADSISVNNGRLFAPTGPGNVGIGTTSPEANLDLTNSQVIRGDELGYALFVPKKGSSVFGDNSDRFELRVDPSSPVTFLGNTYTGTGSARALAFLSGSAERMRIDTSGNVGIGTPSPAGPLQVGTTNLIVQRDQGGSLEIGGTNKIANTVTSGTPYIDFHFGIGQDPQDFNARIINAADNRLDIATASGGTVVTVSGGNVGIGTAGPEAKVEISASGNHLLLDREQTETTGGNIVFLELRQMDVNPPGVPIVYPSIRFHHAFRFWTRIEGRDNGIHFKEGNTGFDFYTPIYASAFTVSSSKQFKKDITDNHYGLAEILKLQAHKFRYIDDPTNKEQIGFMAEDVAKLMPEVVQLDSEDKPMGIDYGKPRWFLWKP